jgi:hypothetical protein
MEISLEDVRHALVELGRLRFGEMRVEDAIREIVETTHSMFAVDGAGHDLGFKRKTQRRGLSQDILVTFRSFQNFE